MANPSTHASGTQTTTVTTEHSLTTVTVAGTFQLVVDLSPMVAGDVVELRWKEKLLTGGAQRGGRAGIYYGPQPVDDQFGSSEFIANINTDSASLEFTLLQRFGSSRSFPWQVFKYT